MMNALTLTFEDTTFDAVDRDGQVWLRGPQIADALGMRDRRGIHDLYTRNAAEFSENMTTIIRLHTAGGVQDVRVFSLRGAHLLGMLARTEKAQAFRRWVLDILDGLTQPLPPEPVAQERTEQMISATRLFNAFLRVGRNLRLGESRAAVAANQVALEQTGVDVLRQMTVDPAELLAVAELTTTSGEADQLAGRLKAWLDASPAPDVTTDEIIAGLGLAVADHERRNASTRLGILMSRLGWKRRERRSDYRRRYIYQRPAPADRMTR